MGAEVLDAACAQAEPAAKTDEMAKTDEAASKFDLFIFRFPLGNCFDI